MHLLKSPMLSSSGKNQQMDECVVILTTNEKKNPDDV